MNRDPSRYIHRTLEATLVQAAQAFPALWLTGPRQAGKTTLVRHAFPDYDYIALDSHSVRALALEDPQLLLADHPPPLIIDEVQNAPELLSYIKAAIDNDRHHMGRYVITGSQQLALASTISESLAGRVAVLTLMPLTLREIVGDPGRQWPWERAADETTDPALTPTQLWQRIVTGSFPEPVIGTAMLDLWFDSYVQTYLERDVRALRDVGDLAQFRNFMQAVAARSGLLFSLSGISRDLGISVTTVRSWLSVLEASFVVWTVRPYHENFGTRLVKAPKVYMTDTGLLCSLVRLADPQHAASGPMAGQLFETFVANQLAHGTLHAGRRGALSYWRTSHGVEVDLLFERDATTMIAIEAKSTATPLPRMAQAIERMATTMAGRRKVVGYVVHAGESGGALSRHVRALPVWAL